MPDSTDPTDGEITVAPTLPGLELPEYHGRRPAGMKASVTGSSNRITQAHDLGARVIVVGELKVKKAGHEETEKDGLLYTEGLNVLELFEVSGPSGARLLSAVRSAYRTATDGETPIPFDPGAQVKTDASGVVITPADALSIEGDSLVRSLTDETMTPVVVLYSDGARELWPDEFDPDDPRPVVGTVVLDANEVESVVTKLLHAETGETLEEWTAEQEEARLLEKEHAAMLAEAGEDRQAFEEILGDRAVELAEEVPAPDLAEQIEPPADEPTDDNVAPFPGYADDPPDDEVTFVEDEDGFADVVAESVGEALEEPLAEVVPMPAPYRKAEEETAEVAAADPTREPTGEECLFVDREIKDLKPMIAELTDRDEVLGYLIAEEAGRGRKLKPRKGVLEALSKRAAELFTAEGFAPPGLPGEVDGFAPPEGEDEFGEGAE